MSAYEMLPAPRAVGIEINGCTNRPQPNVIKVFRPRRGGVFIEKIIIIKFGSVGVTKLRGAYGAVT